MALKYPGLAQAELRILGVLLGPSFLAFLETNFFGKILSSIIKMILDWANNKGIRLMDVGVEWANALHQRKDFDGKLESAIKIVGERYGELSKEEAKAIDDPVINAFNKFVDLSGTKLF